MRNDFVASGIVLNEEGNKVLLIHHKKLNKWLPPGGHLDENELPHDCAMREVFEETGTEAELVNATEYFGFDNEIETQLPAPYCVIHEVIPATGKDVEHMHVDFVYLMRASEKDIVPQEKEINDAKWFSLGDVNHIDTFKSVKVIVNSIMKSIAEAELVPKC